MSDDLRLERVSEICLSLQDVERRTSHGVPAFAVAGKMFACYRDNLHGDGKIAVCVKTGGREEQEMLIESDPGLYSWPPYIGPSGWIAIDIEPADTDWDHVADRIAQSWELAAPRRLLEAGGR